MQRAPYAFWHFIELNRGGGTGDSWADWQAELGFIQVCSLPVRERTINTIFLALAAKGRVGLQRLGECGPGAPGPEPRPQMFHGPVNPVKQNPAIRVLFLKNCCLMFFAHGGRSARR